MKIVAISDTHMQHEGLKIPEGDVLIHSGDALGRGTIDEVIKFNAWLGTLPHKYKIYVPGNHDEPFEKNPEEAKSHLSNAIVLIDEEIEIEGKRIYGCPWVPTFYDWSFMKSEAQLLYIYDRIPKDLDILITHGPPYDILDYNRRGDLCGSISLKHVVLQKNPKYHVFGHIHEASGMLQIENKGTTYINAAVLNDWYNFYKEPKTFII